ncbi:MAG TPA: hypothetical protein VGF93_23195 [Solirubrobacteraceae bacterium]|jgi:hypothetical protein
MDGPRGAGRVVFAAVLLMLGGVLNVIYGIAAIGNSNFYSDHANFMFSNLKTWGWVVLIIGVLELFAAFSLTRGNTYGRWFAIGVGSLNAVAALLSISAYPLWSIAIFGLSLWIIHGLFVYDESAA